MAKVKECAGETPLHGCDGHDGRSVVARFLGKQATGMRKSWKRLGAGGTGDGDVPITHSIRSCINAALAIARLCTAQCREPGHSSLTLVHGRTMPKSGGCRRMTKAPFKRENPDKHQDGLSHKGKIPLRNRSNRAQLLGRYVSYKTQNLIIQVVH
jgi:hypothetical protein